MSLFPEQEAAPKHDADALNPLHWFIAMPCGDKWAVRNVTLKQDLLGEYDTKDAANKAIKGIAANNPRFRMKVAP